MLGSWHYWPAGKLGRDFADDASGSAPACRCQTARVVAECGWGGWPVVGGTAPLTKLGSMEGAATGCASGKTSVFWRANAYAVIGGWGWRKLGVGTWKKKQSTFYEKMIQRQCREVAHVCSLFSPPFVFRVIVYRGKGCFWWGSGRGHGLEMSLSCRGQSRSSARSWGSATRDLWQTKNKSNLTKNLIFVILSNFEQVLMLMFLNAFLSK